MGTEVTCYTWGCQDKSVPRELLELFSIISFDEEPNVVGSFSYPEKHKYPGDIDVFEHVVLTAESVEDALNVYSNWYSNMARRFIAYNRSVSQRKDFFLIDFKAGMYLDKDGTKQKLRWSIKELSDQIAIRNGVKYTFADALSEGTVVKGDYATNYQGRLIAVEIFYFLEYKIGNSVISLSHLNTENYRDIVIEDVLKYSDRDSSDFKPIKALKRLWVVATVDKNAALANRIAVIFGSDSAAFYQAREIIDLVILLIEKYDKCQVPLDQIIQSALAVAKIAFNHGSTRTFVHIDNLLDRVWNIYQRCGVNGRGSMLDVLKKLFDYLTKLTEEEPLALLYEIMSDSQFTIEGIPSLTNSAQESQHY